MTWDAELTELTAKAREVFGELAVSEAYLRVIAVASAVDPTSTEVCGDAHRHLQARGASAKCRWHVLAWQKHR